MARPDPLSVTAAQAAAFARIALDNIGREYPNQPQHLLLDAADLRAPRRLHPVFYGSYDWHSSVHMHWLLVRVLRTFPRLPQAGLIRSAFASHFTDANVAAEIDYLRQPARQSFERPYGWAWLLKLQAELSALACADRDALAWRAALQPLAELIVARHLQFLPLARYPVRSGTHGNSAFGLLLALDYAQQTQHHGLCTLIEAKAHAWFGGDRRYPAAYEPGGEDFLSAGLVEAALMRRVIADRTYADWWEQFCPAPPDLQVWLTPVTVTDRSDPKLAHLDGLNLSRAWCWKMMAPALPPALQAAAAAAIDAHLAASLPFAVGGDYAGTHWLASFALLALTA